MNNTPVSAHAGMLSNGRMPPLTCNCSRRTTVNSAPTAKTASAMPGAGHSATKAITHAGAQRPGRRRVAALPVSSTDEFAIDVQCGALHCLQSEGNA
ncbi:hypothetical protein D3C81_864160 [compost metagenome]